MPNPVLAFDSQAWLPWNEDAPLAYTGSRTAGDVAATVPVHSRYAIGEVEAAASNGVYLRTDETVTFALDALPFTPKPRDYVTPAGLDPRVVLEAVENRFLRFWSLKVRDLALTYDLRDTCTVRRSSPTPDAVGVRVANYADLSAGVPCRLQPLTLAVEPGVAGKVVGRTLYRCYLGTPLALAAGDLVVVGGVKYETTGQGEIDRFDTLTSVQCSRIG